MSNLVLFEGLNEFFAGAEQVVPGPGVLLVVELHVFPVHLDDAVYEYMIMMVMIACSSWSNSMFFQSGKKQSKRPISHFLPKRRVISYLYPSHRLSTFYDPSQYLSLFLSCSPRVNEFPFSRICTQKKLSACCGLNLDATDLPHS